MRAPTACITCRNRRRRCDIPAEGVACKYCAARRIECIGGTYSGTSTAREEPPSTAVTTSIWNVDGEKPKAAQTTSIPSQKLCMELVALYFDFIHDCFHSLFHRPSLEEDVLQGTVPPIILYGIMALSARFSTNPAFATVDPKDRSRGFTKECAKLLDLDDISLTTIQACVLLGCIAITEAKSATEAVYYSVAARMALLMDLAHRPTSNAVDAEVNKRVWWTMYMIDTWSSTGVRLPKLMPHLEDLPLPISETAFLSARRDNDWDMTYGDAPSASEPSLLAQMIMLNYILVEINSLNSLTANNPGVIFEDRIRELSQRLDDWYEQLPFEMRDNQENLLYWASKGLGRIFVAVYLGYYHFGQLLFYQFLHEDCHDNLSSAHSYAVQCKAHSTALCDILYRSHSTPNCDVLYTMVGHVTCIASSVQIHILVFDGDDEQVTLARTRLERNFEILTKLRAYWPTLEASFSRLRAFHKACQKSVSTSFRLDQWMLGFLTEFAKPMDERDGEREERRPEPEWLVDNLGISPQSSNGMV